MGYPPILTPRRIADAAIRPRWWYGLLRYRRMTMRSITDVRGAAGAVESLAIHSRQIRPDISWGDVASLRDRWDGPFYLKGILEPADAIGDRATVLLDGGIRCGTDVVTALALGADAVLIGRPFLYGLAVAGGDGVGAVLDILAAEIRQTLLLMGVVAARDLNRENVAPSPR